MMSVATRCLVSLFVISFGAANLAAESPARAKLRIVTLGDSITRGVRTGVTAEQTFASLLQTELRKTGSEVEVINVGIGGEKTNSALARLDNDVIAKLLDVVKIMYGTRGFKDRGWLAAVLLAQKRRRTVIHGELTPYCQLPSGGDCAYLEAVEAGNNMLVSFYSTHEDSTNIYLATVPLQSVP